MRPKPKNRSLTNIYLLLQVQINGYFAEMFPAFSFDSKAVLFQRSKTFFSGRPSSSLRPVSCHRASTSGQNQGRNRLQPLQHRAPPTGHVHANHGGHCAPPECAPGSHGYGTGNKTVGNTVEEMLET